MASTPAEAEITLTRETADNDPCVLVPSHALRLSSELLVVGWCCWDTPLHRSAVTTLCSMAHSARAGGVVVCHHCQREYGVFANRSAPDGAVVVTVR